MTSLRWPVHSTSRRKPKCPYQRMMCRSIGFSPISSIGLGRMAATSPSLEPRPPQSRKIGMSAGSGVSMQRLGTRWLNLVPEGSARLQGLVGEDLIDQPVGVMLLQKRSIAVDRPGDRLLDGQLRAPAQPAPRLLGRQLQAWHLGGKVAGGRAPRAAAEALRGKLGDARGGPVPILVGAEVPCGREGGGIGGQAFSQQQV